jgi:hypothetical protein
MSRYREDCMISLDMHFTQRTFFCCGIDMTAPSVKDDYEPYYLIAPWHRLLYQISPVSVCSDLFTLLTQLHRPDRGKRMPGKVRIWQSDDLQLRHGDRSSSSRQS